MGDGTITAAAQGSGHRDRQTGFSDPSRHGRDLRWADEFLCLHESGVDERCVYESDARTASVDEFLMDEFCVHKSGADGFGKGECGAHFQSGSRQAPSWLCPAMVRLRFGIVDPRTGMPRVGMVGGGQLARMTHQAAIALGQSLAVLSVSEDDCAALVTPDVQIGHHADLAALRRFGADCDVITFDHEHVPTEHIRTLAAEGHALYPGADALQYAQDKSLMRERLAESGIPVPPFEVVPGPGATTRRCTAPTWRSGSPPSAALTASRWW